MPDVYRQGDVIFRRIERPTFAEKESDRLEIYGETGKPHVVNAPVYRSGRLELLYVEGPTPVPVEHPDHEIIILPPGTYEIRRTQRVVRAFGRRNRAARD
jgi:hypothetical protein